MRKEEAVSVKVGQGSSSVRDGAKFKNKLMGVIVYF